MDEQLKAIVENLIEKTGKGEIEWRGNGFSNFVARISDYTVDLSLEVLSSGHSLKIHSDRAGLLKRIRSSDEEWTDLIRALLCAAEAYHQRIADKALKSLAELLAEPAVEDPALTAILDRDIWSLGLSTHTRNGLTGAGIKTVRDIVSLPDAKKPLEFRNLGRVSAREIETFLSENGLSFGMYQQSNK
jgi:hypothetical protein